MFTSPFKSKHNVLLSHGTLLCELNMVPAQKSLQGSPPIQVSVPYAQSWVPAGSSQLRVEIKQQQLQKQAG